MVNKKQKESEFINLILNLSGVDNTMQIIIDNCLSFAYGGHFCDDKFEFYYIMEEVSFLNFAELTDPQLGYLDNKNIRFSEKIFEGGRESVLQFRVYKNRNLYFRFHINVESLCIKDNVDYLFIELYFDDFWIADDRKQKIIVGGEPLDLDALLKIIPWVILGS